MKHYRQGDPKPEGGTLNRKRTIVGLWKQSEPFECESREGVLIGQSGDYLAQDGHGGFYPISAEFYQNNYEELRPGFEVLVKHWRRNDMKTVRKLGRDLAPGDVIIPWSERTAIIESITPYRGAYEKDPAWRGATVALFARHSQFGARDMLIFPDDTYDVVVDEDSNDQSH